jgi:hypothetical protein
MDETFDIFYAKVDDTHTISDDDTKNTNIECWLEFGPLEWTTDYKDVYHDEPIVQQYHDADLDCGAATFDEAIVKLAKLVRKKYGIYDRKTTHNDCRCPECIIRRDKK